MIVLDEQKNTGGVSKSKLFSAIFFLFSMAALITLVLHFGMTLKPVTKLAEKGHVVLTSADFLEKRTLELAGQWTFFDNLLLEPADIAQSLPHARSIQSTGGWELQNKGGSQVYGYGTYHLDVQLEPTDLALAIHIPNIESSYRLYVDNNLVARGGVVSDSAEATTPDYHPDIIPLPSGIQNFELTLQVSNYHSAWGGLWKPIVIGNVEKIYSSERDLVALSMFVLGALLVTAAFYIIQYSLRPKEQIPLAFACICLIFLLREFTVEHMHFVMNFIGLGFTATMRLNYLTFYLGMPIILFFMNLCFVQTFQRKISRSIYVIAGCFSVFALLAPTRFIGDSLLIYQLVCLVAIFYVLVCLAIAIKHKRPTAKTMMAGSLLVALFAVNDMLHAQNLFATGRFFTLGIVGFIISQSFVINTRFNNIVANNETLSGELKARNVELQLLGAELESKVERRTEQLKLANQELYNLANIDSLTGALNRHGLNSDLQSAFERLRRSREPCCIILFDFDNFKRINDSFGHDVGDKVLVAGAAVIKALIRKQDRLSRWGGEEFLVLLPDTDVKGALAIGNKLRQAIEQQLENKIVPQIAVTVTGGVAEMNQDETFDILFKRADNALYKGKRLGRNCIQT